MNYTRPDNPEYNDTPQDWLGSALIFARALGVILKKNEGVVVELENNVKFLVEQTRGVENPDKAIVCKIGDQVRVIQYDGDSPEGTMVWVQE